MSFTVTGAIDAYIDSVTDEREPDGKYHPSSMFGCLRQAIYGVRGVEKTEPLDDASKRRFYIGHRLHEAVQRALEVADGVEKFFPEFRINMGHTVGAGDALVYADGKWFVVEVKSIKRAGMLRGLPKEHHVNQAKVYAWAVKNYGFFVDDSSIIDGVRYYEPVDVAGILMVYVEKEELQIVEQWIPWDDAWNGEIAERLVELDMYRDDPDSLPPRLPYSGKGKKHWMCGYCPYLTKCYKEDPTEVVPKGGF